MIHEFLNLIQAAEHVHVSANELKHVAQRGEIEAVSRGGDWFFDHAALDEWAQRYLLAETARELQEHHRLMVVAERRAKRTLLSVAALFLPEAIDLAVAAKAKGGILRDMTTLAERTGFVYDPEGLFRELVAREEAATTAIGEGAAFLHPRYHDPYFFERSFIVYGRTANPIFFGAPDGVGTRHFFLICSTDHAEHLHILARLTLLAHGTKLLERLDAAESAEEVLSILQTCEEPYLK